MSYAQIIYRNSQDWHDLIGMKMSTNGMTSFIDTDVLCVYTNENIYEIKTTKVFCIYYNFNVIVAYSL